LLFVLSIAVVIRNEWIYEKKEEDQERKREMKFAFFSFSEFSHCIVCIILGKEFGNVAHFDSSLLRTGLS
jgi:hypothetical protein